MKNTKGITLVALVITVIVLLILAGVTFATLTENGNILERANNAAEQYKSSANSDQDVIDEANSLLDEYFEETTCLAKGTKITMANGSTKNIEDIVIGDRVLTFNHEKGVYEEQEVFCAWKSEHIKSAFTLHFDNGKNISIVGMHDLFEKESLKYVVIAEEDAESFVGKHFYNVEDKKYVELLYVTKENIATEFYSIYVKYTGNCIANGMISIADDADEILNIYNFNEDFNN